MNGYIQGSRSNGSTFWSTDTDPLRASAIAAPALKAGNADAEIARSVTFVEKQEFGL